jgi:hypothetical protein
MLLEQADVDEIVPLSPARAMAVLHQCHFPPFWSPKGRLAALDSLERLVLSVPAYRLRNRLGGDAPRLLMERLSQGAAK